VGILAGGSLVYAVTGTIDPLFVGTLTNTVTVAPPPGLIELDPGDNSATDTTEVAGAPLVGATKAVSGGFYPQGWVTYTVVLANSGDAAQSDNPGDELVDVLPAELALVSAAATAGTAAVDLAGNTVTWNGSIPASATVTVTIRATVNAGATGVVSNQGTVAYDADLDGVNESSVLTDDPTVGGVQDPTTFQVEEVLFADGFESGDTLRWSWSPP
jgi:uncharacterized repeat protein (TIGR01451 family)